MFEEHIVDTYFVIQSPVCIEYLSFKKPKTNLYRIDYTLVGTTLFIRGDYGEATYQWKGADVDSLAWIADIKDYDYFYRKCVAVPVMRSDGSARFLLWDQGKFLQHVKHVCSEELYLRAVSAEIEENALSESDIAIWMEELSFENKKLYVDLEDVGLDTEAGYAIHPWCQIHLDGLREAVKRLKSPPEERSTECETTETSNEKTASTTSPSDTP